MSHSQKYRWDNENVREYEIKEAQKKNTYALAERLKNLGISTKDISLATGLSEEGIERL